MESFWIKRCRIAIETEKRHCIAYARCNPDYIQQHPQEHKQNPECKILKECHPEASKRVEKEMLTLQHRAIIPTVKRPVRVNR